MNTMKLRGTIEWRHRENPPDYPPVRGECFADYSWKDSRYVVWTEFWRDWLGGGHWDSDLAQLTACDENAMKIIEWANKSLPTNSYNTSKWTGDCNLCPFSSPSRTMA